MENINLIIGIGIIGLLIGYVLGYSLGVGWALNWGVKNAIAFAEKQGIEIKLNPAMIATGLYQYKNNLGGCLFTNASIYSNERNKA